MHLNERRIVITGATGGIGEALARRLAGEGARLLLTGRGEERLAALHASLPGEGHLSVAADLTTDAGILELVSAADALAADTLVNCLGVNQLATLEDSSAAEVQQMIGTNLVAPINTCRALLPQLRQRPSATIVNVGSILGSIGYAGSTLYCASKFGLRGFSEALRRELADSTVKVIYFAPRATATALNSEAMNRMNEVLGNAVDSPALVAEKLVAVLRKDRSGNSYLGRPESFFVRLNALLPSLVDRAVSQQLPTIKTYCQPGSELLNPRRPA